MFFNHHCNKRNHLIFIMILCLLHFTGCQHTWSPTQQSPHTSVWRLTQRHFAIARDPQHLNPKLYATPNALYQTLKPSTPYYYYILSEVLKKQMPAELALLPFIESNYNPFAYSLAGATGLWQMMPGTGAGMGLTINWWYDGRRDIITSTQAALTYLQHLHQQFHGDWLLAIAAYDAGEGRVKKR